MAKANWTFFSASMLFEIIVKKYWPVLEDLIHPVNTYIERIFFGIVCVLCFIQGSLYFIVLNVSPIVEVTFRISNTDHVQCEISKSQ